MVCSLLGRLRIRLAEVFRQEEERDTIRQQRRPDGSPGGRIQLRIQERILRKRTRSWRVPDQQIKHKLFNFFHGNYITTETIPEKLLWGIFIML